MHMRNLNIIILIATFVSLVSCSKGDENTNQATMKVQESKSAAKEIPYKGEIEKGLTLQFDYMNIPHGTVETWRAANGDTVSFKGKPLSNDPDKYMEFLFAAQKNGLITIYDKETSDIVLIYKPLYGQQVYNVEWTPKALGLRNEKNSDADWLRIPLGACKVQTIVKDIEYHNPYLSQTDDFRLVMGTFEDKPTDFGKSQGASNVFGVLKFRVVIKLNPFNQTYSYVTGDFGKIDADDWQTHNITQ
jgi:hypothetical protein